jgi:hypothetical protein
VPLRRHTLDGGRSDVCLSAGRLGVATGRMCLCAGTRGADASPVLDLVCLPAGTRVPPLRHTARADLRRGRDRDVPEVASGGGRARQSSPSGRGGPFCPPGGPRAGRRNERAATARSMDCRPADGSAAPGVDSPVCLSTGTPVREAGPTREAPSTPAARARTVCLPGGTRRARLPTTKKGGCQVCLHAGIDSPGPYSGGGSR